MKIFAIYCTAVILFFAWGTHEGYAVSSLFGEHHHGAPGAHGSTYYHK